MRIFGETEEVAQQKIKGILESQPNTEKIMEE
jgi:hypothetical protein